MALSGVGQWDGGVEWSGVGWSGVERSGVERSGREGRGGVEGWVGDWWSFPFFTGCSSQTFLIMTHPSVTDLLMRIILTKHLEIKNVTQKEAEVLVASVCSLFFSIGGIAEPNYTLA